MMEDDIGTGLAFGANGGGGEGEGISAGMEVLLLDGGEVVEGRLGVGLSVAVFIIEDLHIIYLLDQSTRAYRNLMQLLFHFLRLLVGILELALNYELKSLLYW